MDICKYYTIVEYTTYLGVNIRLIILIFVFETFVTLAATIETSVLHEDGNVMVQWNSVSGNNYSISYSTNLVDDPFDNMAGSQINAISATTEFEINSSNETAFYRVEPETPLTNGSFSIIQSWSQESNYSRPVEVSVPNGGGRYPVVIKLHGAGGSGNINSFGYINNAIHVAPTGYLNFWNIGKEPSKAPDVDFIRQIIRYLRAHSNVDENRITIIGSSNGGALLNRLMIELEDGMFHQGVGVVTCMISNMYDGVHFRYDSSDAMEYDEIISPPTNRRMLTVCGEDDPVVPYYGGIGIWQNYFYSAQDSTHIWAKLMGYQGSPLQENQGQPNPTNNNLVKYSYLNDDIVLYKHVGKEHNAGSGADVRNIIKEWVNY